MHSQLVVGPQRDAAVGRVGAAVELHEERECR